MTAYTIDNKLSKVFLGCAVAGFIGGFGGHLYVMEKYPLPQETEAISKIQKIEHELETITCREITENPQRMHEYQRLSQDYNTLLHDSSVAEEKIKYDEAVKEHYRLDNPTFNFVLGGIISFVCAISCIRGKEEEKEKEMRGKKKA